MNAGTGPSWEEIDSVFQRILDAAPVDRAALTARLTEGSPALRSKVEGLLEAVDRSEDFLEEPPSIAEALDLESVIDAARAEAQTIGSDPSRAGEHVGPFRLLEALGRGGMATVYRAERVDGQWDHEVAIKLLRRGVDTDDIVRRFRAERQILSSLRHPHIARLIDGGTTEDGLPFLAMELVVGQPITEACDAKRATLAQRLKLFASVARAVHHAHSHLVVHRDLKPSNVLVDTEGEPRLLDFGIAKVLDKPDDARTATGMRLLTPDFASPEQLRAEPITTATDVYQLGVLLCILVAGSPPWEGRGVDPETGRRGVAQASRLVTDEAAAARSATRSSIVRQLRGDLGAIVRQATEEDPARRYASAEALADDVQRFLDGQPVRARAGGWGYAALKWARRHPWIPTAATVAAIVAGGYAYTLETHASELEVERNAARAEAERAQETQALLLDLFGRPDPYGTNATGRSPADVTVLEALDGGVERIRSELGGRPALQASLLGAVADVYTNVGRGAQSVDLHAAALEAAEAAGASTEDLAFRVRKLGRTLVELGRTDSARVVLAAGLAGEALSDSATAHLLHQFGRAERADGRFLEAERYFHDALSRAEGAGRSGAALRSDGHAELAATYAELDRPELAIDHARLAVSESREIWGAEHASTAVKTVGLAAALVRAGRVEEGVSEYGRGIDALARSFGADHPNTLRARQNLALALGRLGDLPAAEAELRTLLALHRDRYGPHSSETASTLQNLGTNLKSQGELDEALALLGEARVAFIASRPAGHYLTALPLLTMAEIHLDRRAWAQAEVVARDALSTLVDALPAGHYITAVAECRWGRALVAQGRVEAGGAALGRAVPLLQASATAPELYVEECTRALSDVERG